MYIADPLEASLCGFNSRGQVSASSQIAAVQYRCSCDDIRDHVCSDKRTLETRIMPSKEEMRVWWICYKNVQHSCTPTFPLWRLGGGEEGGEGGQGWRLNRQTDSGRTFSCYNTSLSGSLSVCLSTYLCCFPTVYISMFVNNAGVGLELGLGLENIDRSKEDQRHC